VRAQRKPTVRWAFQRLRVLGRARALQVAGGGVHAQLQVAHMACDERRVGEGATAHHAVHVVAHHVHRAVAHAHVDKDVGVLRVERGQRGDEDQARQGAGHVHPQAAPGRGGGGGNAGIGIVQVGQQAHHALVVGGAIGRDLHAPGGAVQELHAQARFELLHQLRDGGAAQVQGEGSLGEAAGFHNAGEGLQGVKTVHGVQVVEACRGGCVPAIVWRSGTVVRRLAGLSKQRALLQCLFIAIICPAERKESHAPP